MLARTGSESESKTHLLLPWLYYAFLFYSDTSIHCEYSNWSLCCLFSWHPTPAPSDMYYWAAVSSICRCAENLNIIAKRVIQEIFDGLRGFHCCVTRRINTGAEEFVCWYHFCVKTTPYNHNNKMILASTMPVISDDADQICPISIHLSNTLCEAIGSKVKLISATKIRVR